MLYYITLPQLRLAACGGKRERKSTGLLPHADRGKASAASLLQVLCKLHFLRKCNLHKTCKKSFRSPKATILKNMQRVRFIFLQGQPLWFGQREVASTDDWPPDGGDHEGFLPERPPKS